MYYLKLSLWMETHCKKILYINNKKPAMVTDGLFLYLCCYNHDGIK
jgi:hypothetical protein